MATPCTDRFMDTVQHLPDRVKQVMSVLGSLDTARQDLEVRSNLTCKRINRLGPGPKRRAAEAELAKLQRCLLNMCDVKLGVAKSLYNAVDYHVQTLDSTLGSVSARLRAFDSHTIQTAMALCSENWRAERSRAGASSNPATGQRNTRSRPRSSRQAAPTGQAGLSTAAGLASPALTLDARLDAPVNPYEPTYCTCGQVAFGEMIACDAEDCSVEWFHCACVGIAPSNRPKDKWYCPTCAPRVAASGGAGGVQPALGYSGSASAASPTAGGGHSGSLASPTSTQADVFIPGLGHLSAFAHGRGSDVAGAVLAGSTGAVPASLVPSGPEAPRPLKRPRATTSPTHSPASVLSQVLADAQGVDTSWSVRRVADEASQVPSARLRRAVARRRRQAAQVQSSDAGSSDSASEAGSLTDSDSASASSSVSEPSPPLTRSQRRKAPRYV